MDRMTPEIIQEFNIKLFPVKNPSCCASKQLHFSIFMYDINVTLQLVSISFRIMRNRIISTYYIKRCSLAWHHVQKVICRVSIGQSINNYNLAEGGVFLYR